MKRRALFGPFCIPALSVVLAILVSACHQPDFTPSVTSVHINRSSLVLSAFDSPYNFLESYTLVVTLRPSTAWHGARIEWGDDSENRIVFIQYDTMQPPGEQVAGRIIGRFGEDGRAEVKIVGYSKGTTFVYARVTAADESVFYVWCTVVVELESTP